MTRALTFETSVSVAERRRVRASRFQARSSLPLSSACLVANALRESLRSIFAIDLEVRLLEPVIPSAPAWALIGSDAVVFGVGGPLGEAALILRPRDAFAISQLAFGEPVADSRPLSPIEERVLARAITALATTLSPICGVADHFHIRRLVGPLNFTAYFEVLLEGAAQACIGIAVAREAPVVSKERLTLADLLDVEVCATAEVAFAHVSVEELLHFSHGQHVAFHTPLHGRAQLRVDRHVFALGEGGLMGHRRAFHVLAEPAVARHS
ncbi:MAG: hypothetical protein NVS1B14_04960 [Vulcanimicrobiaceae bacterium]